MATITQTSEYKTVVGWYGKCNYDSNGQYTECADLPITQLKQYVSSVYQWTSNGFLKAWNHNLPDAINSRVFDKLECGKLYYMTIKPSSTGNVSQFQIPNFTPSTYEDETLGLLTEVCDLPDPTPTPIDCICAPGDFAQININSKEVAFDSHIFSNFSPGSVVYYDDSKFGKAVGAYIMLKFPNNTLAGVIEFTSIKPENCDFYLKYGNRCYKATATDNNVNSSGIWELTLSQTEILPDDCGELIEPPTPTPEPKPTPTPVECDCVDGENFTKVNITSQSGTQNNGHNFVNFDTGSSVYYDESTLSTSSASLCVVNYVGHSLQSSIEFTGKKPSSSTKIYIKRGNQCFSGNVVSKTGFYQCDVSLSETLDDVCGDKIDFPTPTPQVQPTPTPEPKPTPTPVECDCVDGENFRKVNITSQSGTQDNGHNFVNFDVENVIYYDESTLSTSSASLCVVNYVGHSLQSSIEFTGKKPSSSTKIYIKRGNQCFSGNVVSKTGFYQCDVSLSETLDGTCGDASDFPTPTPQVQPTPTPEPKPTPTPVKSTNWSKPTTHTEISTKGGSDEVLYKIKSNNLDYVLFSFRGFATSGKLYVDLTFKSGSFNPGDIEPFETTRTVYIKETGKAIGAVKKLYQNGADKNTIYYFDPTSGNVYKGDIVGTEPKVWMEFVGKKDVNQVCCPDSYETMTITNGKTTTTNQITVNAIASGEMDGKLCWPKLDGFASPTSYIVKFEGLDQSEETTQAIMISTTIKVTDVTFRYEHKFGQCYEGKLNSENVIFNKV